MNAMQPPQSIEEIKSGLETTEKGGVRQSIRNCLTVFQRDPLLSGAIAYNILTDRQSVPQVIVSATTIVCVLVSMIVMSIPMTIISVLMVCVMLLVSKHVTKMCIRDR